MSEKEYVDWLHDDKCYTCVHGNVCTFRNDIHKVVKGFEVNDRDIKMLPIIPICSFYTEAK